MHDAGKAEKGVIRPEFNRSVVIDFQGAKITSDAGVLMLREVDERFGIMHHIGLPAGILLPSGVWLWLARSCIFLENLGVDMGFPETYAPIAFGGIKVAGFAHQSAP